MVGVHPEKKGLLNKTRLAPDRSGGGGGQHRDGFFIQEDKKRPTTKGNQKNAEQRE